MKALLILSCLFFLSNSSKAAAQSSPYIDSHSYYTVEPAPVRVLPVANVSGNEPRGFYYDAEEEIDEEYDSDDYVDYIRHRGKLRCGTNLQLKTYAVYENDEWKGIDADMCKAFALAIIGDANKIEMVDVDAKNVSKFLQNGKIDVMLSGVPFFAKEEISGDIESAGLLYYEPQKVMVAEDDEEISLSKYNGKKMCMAIGSDYYRNFEMYSTKHDLDLNYLPFNDMNKVREGFLLKRCALVTGGALFLEGMKKSLRYSNLKIFSDKIAMSPVYAMVSSENPELRLAIKWILNALYLAEQYEITARSLQFFSGHSNQEIRNLLGDDPELWQALNLRPHWLHDVVAMLGNYGEIYERNLGEESEYKINRDEGKLQKDGGTVSPLPFM
ncbi:MAG: transporter substrate-binding domain-containing protein [Alphaproteobacteria bacterium]|nr:transporter substrate-binding domain-containing protein [Alphaproteobacteria bacterium]